jgi:hypothetical protein
MIRFDVAMPTPDTPDTAVPYGVVHGGLRVSGRYVSGGTAVSAVLAVLAV